MKTRLLGLLFFVFLIFGSPHAVQAGLIFSVDYEDGAFGAASKSSSGQTTTTGYPSLCCNHSAQLVSSPVRTGTKAVKMTLLPTDNGYIYGGYKDPVVRAEFERWGVSHIGDVRWYALSVNVDPSYLDTSTDPNGTIVLQLHTNRDSCDVPKSPHLEIHITASLGWRIRNHSDSNSCTSSVGPNRIDWNVGPVTKGVWVDWVIYAKWSYNSDGVLKVWKDGKLAVERYGPNTYNDQNDEFVKWGVYKSWWDIKPASTSDNLTVHLDQIKIGDANSSYGEVAPSGGSSSTASATPVSPTSLQAIVK